MDSSATPQDELRQCWHEDMLWWGPTGIGATYTIDRYIQQHQRPFRTQNEGRRFNGHICRMAEGQYGGFSANLSLKPTGGYLGMPPYHDYADMRVVDIYRREGDKLAENWIFRNASFSSDPARFNFRPVPVRHLPHPAPEPSCNKTASRQRWFSDWLNDFSRIINQGTTRVSILEKFQHTTAPIDAAARFDIKNKRLLQANHKRDTQSM